MEANPIWRDWSPPSEAISASACSEKGSRPSIARSAPRRLFDCVRTLDCKLSRNEKATTMDTTPRTTQDMARSSGFSPRLASRSAMLQTHFLKIDFIMQIYWRTFSIRQHVFSPQRSQRPRRFRQLLNFQLLNFVLFASFVV